MSSKVCKCGNEINHDSIICYECESKYKSNVLDEYEEAQTRININNSKNKYINPKGSYERKFLRGRT